jgi:hypothetical protein
MLMLVLGKFVGLTCFIFASFLCNFCYHIGLSMVDEMAAQIAAAIFRRYQIGALDGRQLTVLPNRLYPQWAINNELSG